MRYTTLSYKNKKQIQNPESKWLRFENTHEAIVSKELWDIVQGVRNHKRRFPKRIDEKVSPFSGMLYCADCSSVMRVYRKRGNPTAFKCSRYSKYGTEDCTAHYIHERQLEAIVLDDLRRVITTPDRKNGSLWSIFQDVMHRDGKKRNQPHPKGTG